MTGRSFFLGSILLLALLPTACGAASAPQMRGAAAQNSIAAFSSGAETQQLAEYGHLERQRMDIPKNAPAAIQGKTFSISAQELHALCSEYQLAGNYSAEEAMAMARQELTEKYALYSHATAQGFAVEESVLDALIADEQAFDEISAGDRRAFLQGFGADESLYWSLRREDLRMYETIDLWRQSCRSTYAGEDFSAYCAALTEDILEAEQITVLA